MKGKLYVVATPIGNLADISSNALDILNSVDLIAAEDTRVTINLLRHFNIKTPLVSYHKFNEITKSNTLIEKLMNGSNIAIVTDAGTPCISDPGSIIVKEAIKKEIEVFSIPGASAIITALTVSGFEISSFTFYGFLEREKSKILKQIKTIKNDSSKIAVIYESPKRIMKTLEILSEELDNPLACLCNDLTKKFERKYYGKINDIILELNNNPSYELGEYVLVIEKNDAINEESVQVSIEAKLIDIMINNNLSLKEAIKELSRKEHNITHKQVYDASLRLKSLFKEE